MDIVLNATKSELIRTDSKLNKILIVDRTQKINVIFNYQSDIWQDQNCTAIFKNGDREEYVQIEDGQCEAPLYLISAPYFEITLYCEDIDAKTAALKIYVSYSWAPSMDELDSIKNDYDISQKRTNGEIIYDILNAIDDSILSLNNLKKETLKIAQKAETASSDITDTVEYLNSSSSTVTSILNNAEQAQQLIEDIQTGIENGEFKGDTGDSGVYIGDTEPTDPNVQVWISPSDDTTDDSTEYVTVEMLNNYDYADKDWVKDYITSVVSTTMAAE